MRRLERVNQIGPCYVQSLVTVEMPAAASLVVKIKERDSHAK